MVAELILVLKLVLLLLLHLTLEFLSLLMCHIVGELWVLYLRLENHLCLAILGWVVLQVHHQQIIVWLRYTNIYACHIVEVLLLWVEWFINLGSIIYHRERSIPLIVFIAINFLIKLHKLSQCIFLHSVSLDKFEK